MLAKHAHRGHSNGRSAVQRGRAGAMLCEGACNGVNAVHVHLVIPPLLRRENMIHPRALPPTRLLDTVCGALVAHRVAIRGFPCGGRVSLFFPTLLVRQHAVTYRCRPPSEEGISHSG